MLILKKCEECLKGINEKHQKDLDFERDKAISGFKEKLKERISFVMNNSDYDEDELLAEIDKTAQETK